MKNINKYIIIPILLIISLIYFGAYGTKVNFGTAWFKDAGLDSIVPNKKIYMLAGDSLYYNGVVVTSGTGGGGIAASDNITFTGRDSTAELWRFGDSVRFYEHVLFKDTLKVSGAIAVMDSLKVSKNLWFNNTTKLSTTLNTFYILENAFQWQNQNAYNILDLDSSNGMNLHYGVYTGSGTGLTNVDAITLKGQDTTHFAHTDTLTTERIKAKTEFSDIVTFFLSPVFSALVTIGNGETVNGTATFNGDMVNTGWKKIGSSKTQYQYTRDTVIWAVCATGPTTITTTHGLGNIGRLISYTCVIKDDSSGLLVSPGVSTGLVAVGLTPQAPTFDATNIYFRITGPMVNLDDNTDTIKYFIKYSDFQR